MKPLTPIKAIRKKCLECQNNQYSLVRGCESKGCPLYRFRMGKRPGPESADKLAPARGVLCKTR